MSNTKRVYSFGNKVADGDGSMKNLLGGKGANLAEMGTLGIPVPPGFTITTDVCTEYFKKGQDAVIKLVKPEVEAAMAAIEKQMGMEFGSNTNPLLMSVRSGARVSLPGMMDTILNLGLNDDAVLGLAKRSGNERFAWDSYRRFIQMYGDVVMDMKPESKIDRNPFEHIIDVMKEERKISDDADFSVEDLKEMVRRFKEAVLKQTGRNFPTDPWEQLWGSISAVFDSWMNPRAELYRQMHGYSSVWGTAVNIQVMVFGNMGKNSATGVAFTRDAGTGENIFNGEYLVDAQGEDVVAGVRTPQEVTLEGSLRWAALQGVSEADRKAKYPSLEEVMPKAYSELFAIQERLEKYYKDMQDVEFTIQDGKLWMLQTRSGKRTGGAMVRIAMEMLKEGMIDEKAAILRVEAAKLDELLHPVFDTTAIQSAKILGKGLPASPGASSGQIVFFAEDAARWKAEGKQVILVRTETSPEDLAGMNAAEGILTARGGMTSHAAVVARGMGKCCVSGVGALVIDYKTRSINIDGNKYKEGDWISLNGTTGEIYEGEVKTMDAELSGDFEQLMNLTDKYATMKVRTNADKPKDAEVAMSFGAVGIGLCRTEHMFFESDRIVAVREMILADNEKGRREALAKLLPIQRSDFEGIFKAMKGYPVTVRLLDPPLHEFLPHEAKEIEALAKDLKISAEAVKNKIEGLGEINPMLGHRGCRLGNTYPEITEMQSRAIIEAALNVEKSGTKVSVEIMVPLIGNEKEFLFQKEIIDRIAKTVFAEQGKEIKYQVGTMIEVPRATLVADKVAESAEFFSFGTNDLTQMTLGFSRDDIAKFLPIYIERGLLDNDPFQTIDTVGVGELMRTGVERGRRGRKDLKCGICGEHGGDPASVEFCHSLGLNYVSCSPFRVPIARLAAAHAAIKESQKR